jgi:hypothetical protein
MPWTRHVGHVGGGGYGKGGIVAGRWDLTSLGGSLGLAVRVTRKRKPEAWDRHTGHSSNPLARPVETEKWVGVELAAPNMTCATVPATRP